MKHFDTLLIANRGEIACRILRTARRLGLRTVAVYSEADARAQHVALADEAVCIGPAPARESYLDIEALLAAAKRSGAGAVHPGYGFLAENAAFAAACVAAGLRFIGPPAEAIRAMGSKAGSKRLMAAAGVPILPGWHGEGDDDETLLREGARIGYPLLAKASAGGGGKGMRIVHAAEALPAALAAARREALAAFGDGRLLLERYLERARHVEVQVFADAQGRCIALHDRDCSLQRRHQKVVEEAPAPGLDEDTRTRMRAAAITAARAVGYVGAGTVEFMLQGREFFFLEMNTRLQVEHPVTEAITGLDLVEWQLRIADGEPLPLAQEQVPALGHAFEARLCAEDPARDDLPATGRIWHLQLPAGEDGIRVDAGVRAGDVVGPHYDPLLAKVICHGPDRDSALQRFAAALRRCELAGVATNLPLLRAIAAHEAFARAELDTGFLERHRAQLRPPPQPTPPEVLAVAAVATLLLRESEVLLRAAASAPSPWQATDGWRLNGEHYEMLRWREPSNPASGPAGAMREVALHYRGRGYEARVDGAAALQVRDARWLAAAEAGTLCAEVDGRRLSFRCHRDAEALTLVGRGDTWRLVPEDPLLRAVERESGTGRIVAPMPGQVTQLFVAAGQAVERGQPLLVLEAMKMEHTLRAPLAGQVAALRAAVGTRVTEGAELLIISE